MNRDRIDVSFTARDDGTSFSKAFKAQLDATLKAYGEQAAMKAMIEYAEALRCLPLEYQATPRFKGTRRKRKIKTALWKARETARVARARWAYRHHMKASELFTMAAALSTKGTI